MIIIFRAAQNCALQVKRISVYTVHCVLLAWCIGVSLPIAQAALNLPLALISMATSAVVLLCKRHCLLAQCGLALAFGFGWATSSFNAHKQVRLNPDYQGSNITLDGRVASLPRYAQSNVDFDFIVDKVINVEGTAKAKTRLLAIDGVAALQGQRIKLSCYRCSLNILSDQKWRLTVRLKRPRGFASLGSFDYEKFLFRKQIVAKGYVRLKQENFLISGVAKGINELRGKVKQQLLKVAAQRNGVVENRPGLAMLLALSLGDKSLFSTGQRKAFQATGVSHLMAISGLHIGIVFVFTIALLKVLMWPFARVYYWLPQQHLVLLPALAAAVCYAALAGFAVSTQRAILMLAVYVFCKFLARDVSLFKVVLLSASIILLFDPFSALDAGFWLSCSAVVIIAFLNQRIENLSLIRLQPLLWLLMLPITSLLFGQVSIISPLVNLVCVPLFCVLMIPAVFVTMISQLVSTWLFTNLVGYLNYAFTIVSYCLRWLADSSFASYYPPQLDFGFFVVVLSLISLAFFKRCLALSLSAITITFWLCGFAVDQDYDYRVSLLDVGQGLSMVVEVGDYVLVYDTGPAYQTGFNAADAVLLPYLRQRGINKIDTLIISHADNDHIGGLPYLLAQMQVGHILTSRTDKVPQAVACSTGQKWAVNGVQFSMLGPEEATPNGSNNRSCVLRVDNGDISTLITGDIEKQVERFMLSKNKNLKSDIMLVPHQGSKTSSTGDFVDAVHPRLALIAAGYRNHYGHPHSSVVKRYQARNIKLLSTINEGSISLSIKGGAIIRSQFRQLSRRFWHD